MFYKGSAFLFFSAAILCSQVSADDRLSSQNPLGIETVFVEGGSFFMGYCHPTERQVAQRKRDEFVGKVAEELSCDKELNHSVHSIPPRDVLIRDFWVSKDPITLHQYKRYLVESGEIDRLPYFTIESNSKRSDRDPVVAVTSSMAKDLAVWLNENSNYSWSLISEAQWEYICTEGNVGLSQCVDSSYGINVGSGIKELTLDCWHDNYEGAPKSGSAWTSGCEENRPGGHKNLNVVRGGDLGARKRSSIESAMMHRNITFRLVKTNER